MARLPYALPVIAEGMPLKPAWGNPCNGCGWCCRTEVCAIGQKIFGARQPAPCPALTTRDGRHWCGVVEQAAKDAPMMELLMKARLAIGWGCDSEF